MIKKGMARRLGVIFDETIFWMTIVRGRVSETKAKYKKLPMIKAIETGTFANIRINAIMAGIKFIHQSPL
jgi:hypothetical protein